MLNYTENTSLLFFFQKVVLKVDLHDDKEKQKAMKAVSSLTGLGLKLVHHYPCRVALLFVTKTRNGGFIFVNFSVFAKKIRQDYLNHLNQSQLDAFEIRTI